MIIGEWRALDRRRRASVVELATQPAIREVNVPPALCEQLAEATFTALPLPRSAGAVVATPSGY